MAQSSIHLYISTVGRRTEWIKNGIPIEVGAAVRSDFRYELKDDIGDNISALNPWWGELTGLYWVWKNKCFSDEDIIGFGHYNKYLPINKNHLADILKHGQWIVVKGADAIPHDYPEDIETLESVIRDRFPQYLDAWSETYKHDGSSILSGNCHGGELFYATKKEFDRYCEFLFSILFSVWEIEGEVERPVFHKRYIAFLGERMLSVYLRYYKKGFREIDAKYYRDRGARWLIKMLIPPFIKRSSLYLWLSQKSGGGSSYGNKM